MSPRQDMHMCMHATYYNLNSVRTREYRLTNAWLTQN